MLHKLKWVGMSRAARPTASHALGLHKQKLRLGADPGGVTREGKARVHTCSMGLRPKCLHPSASFPVTNSWLFSRTMFHKLKTHTNIFILSWCALGWDRIQSFKVPHKIKIDSRTAHPQICLPAWSHTLVAWYFTRNPET